MSNPATPDAILFVRISQILSGTPYQIFRDPYRITLGTDRGRATFRGTPFERTVELGEAPISSEQMADFDAQDPAHLKQQIVTFIDDHRGRAKAEAEAELQGWANKIDALIEAAPEQARGDLASEALLVLRTEDRSIRKYEKKLRLSVRGEQLSDRVESVQGMLPEYAISESLNGLEVRLTRSIDIRFDGDHVRVPVSVVRIGGDLERTLLTSPLEDFVRATTDLMERLYAEEAERWERFGADIRMWIETRRDHAFFDHASFHDHIKREVRTARDGAAPHAIRSSLQRTLRLLDRAATEKQAVADLIRDRNLFAYRDFFPQARAIKRKLVLFVGPTNSGKTYHALNRLAEAKSGAYLAPLRLLALEGQGEIQKRGHDASFITGEERDLREGARFVASTIEMADLRTRIGAAVIDEVQLLADSQRGWAWTQALVGIPADTVLMTGSPDCIPLVQAFADYLGEPLEIHRLERHTPIQTLPKPVEIEDIKPGTAVIAFSRKDVLGIKAELERRYPVAVIYGNLTPEVRREEARRFREGEAQVLVATDAIAMGLNLPIETVLFFTTQKWNGQDEVFLEDREILQIGGRAGRFGHYEKGYVGSLYQPDLPSIQRVFTSGYVPEDLPLSAQVRPHIEHVEAIAAGLGTDRLHKLLEAFQRGMSFDSSMLSPGVPETMIALAEMVDQHRKKLPLPERLTLASAPVDIRSEMVMQCYTDWVGAIAAEDVVPLPRLGRRYDASAVASDDRALLDAEMEAKTLTLYSWLSFRFPSQFPDMASCADRRKDLDAFIERSLAGRAVRRKCRHCTRTLAAMSRHGVCDRCFSTRNRRVRR